MATPKRKPTSPSATRPNQAKDSAMVPRPPGKIEITVDGVRLDLSPQLEAAVQRACQAQGPPLPAEMTTTQAAEFLDVSRPFVIKLVDQGKLPCRLVGKHRRIPTAALLEYREKTFQRARKAADAMAQQSQSLGLYDE